ncbi:MAG TPA: hypothetical protein DEF72_03000 [Gammaproteobacteria bacterium]|nr:hypothetical protein [Gammaproteobacteria bacterium]
MIGRCFKALASVICAFIGVQSARNWRYDSERGSATVFVIAGILMTIIFLAGIYGLVQVVMIYVQYRG